MNNFPYTLESSSNLSFDSSDCSNIISNKNNRIVIYLLGFSEQSFKDNPTVFTLSMRNNQCPLKSLNVDFSDCQDQIEISIQSLEVDLNNEDVILNNLSSQMDWNNMEDNQFDFSINFQKYIDNDGEIEVDWNLDESKRSTWKDGEIIDFQYYNNSDTDFYFGQNLYVQCELIDFQLSIQYAKNIMMAGFSFINQVNQIIIENFNIAHLLGIKLLETSQIGKNMLQINTGSNIKINQLIIYDIQQSVENQYGGINFNNVENIQIYNFVIKNCFSQNLGIIKIQDASQVLIKKGYILENQLDNGEGQVFEIKLSTSILMTNLYINQAQFTKFFDHNSVIQFQECDGININNIKVYIEDQNLIDTTLIFIKSSENILFQLNEFIQANLQILYLTQSQKILIQNNIFEQINFYNSGLIQITYSDYLLFENNSFYDIQNVDGPVGSLYIMQQQDGEFQFLHIQNLQIIVSSALEGGAIYIKGLNFCNYCYIQNSYFEECKSTQFDGGGLHLTESQNFILKNINFTNNYSQFWGGAIFTEDIEGFIFQNLIFNENYAEREGGAIYLSDNTRQCIFQDLIFKDNVSEMGGGLGGFNNQNLKFDNIKFINNVAMEGGGALFNEIFDLILINIEITGNYAENGGGIAIMDIFSLYMDNIILNSNEAEISGGGLSIIFGEDTQLKNIVCTNNNAQFENGGGIFIDNDSMGIYENIQINNSYASLNAGGFYLGKSMQINIKNLSIQNSYAERNGGGIMLNQCEEVYIYNSDFLFNIAEHVGGGMYVYFSMDINIINSEFNYNEANSSGGGIYSSQNEFFIIDKCTIQNNVGGTQGGGVVVSESFILELIECEILKNLSEENGGGVFINADSDEIIFQNTKISQNQADEMGAGVYIEKSWIIIFEFSEISQNQQNNYGSGIYCLKTDTLFLENTIISDHSSYNGGALYSQQTIFLEIVESEFINNNGVLQGGSLYILEAQFVEIFDSLFQNSTTIQQNIKQGQNSIYSQGGAISYESGSFFGFFNSEVYNCSSYYQGGGIYLNNIIEINIEDSKFEQNKVQYDPFMPLYQKNMSYVVSQGGSIFIQQNILSNFQDQDIDSMRLIFIINNEIIQSMASSGAGIYISVKSNYIQEFIIEQNIFLENIGDLGSAIRILGSLQEYEYQDILENQFELAQNDNLFGEKNEIYFQYYKNEYIINQDSNQFALCSQGSFLDEGSGSQYCNQCLDNGDCEGGYVPIYPSKYYWRENKDSTDFIYCSANPENCLGNDTCQEGNSQKSLSYRMQCLQSVQTNEEAIRSKFYMNLYGIFSTLIIFAFIQLMLFILYLRKKFNKQMYVAYFKGISISFIMTFQPGYLESSLLFVSCQKIGSFYYSKEDSHIMCNSDFYKYEVLPINLTISVLAGLIVPCTLIYLLIKLTKNQENQSIYKKISYGLVYFETKPKFFYWEIITMALKISMVLAVTIFRDELVIRGCFTSIIILIYLFLISQFQPYKQKQINDLAKNCSLIQIISILTITSQQDQIENSASNTYLSVFVLILNILLVFQIFYYMMRDINVQIRSIVFKFQKKMPLKLVKYYYNMTENEKNAKQRWKKIILSIVKSIREKQLNIKDQQSLVNQYEVNLLKSLKEDFNSQSLKTAITLKNYDALFQSKKINRSQIKNSKNAQDKSQGSIFILSPRNKHQHKSILNFQLKQNNLPKDDKQSSSQQTFSIASEQEIIDTDQNIKQIQLPRLQTCNSNQDLLSPKNQNKEGIIKIQKNLQVQSQIVESNQRSQQQKTSKFKDALQKSEIFTYRDEENN